MFLVFFFLLHLLFDGGQLFGPLSGTRALAFPLLRLVFDRFELLLGNDAEAIMTCAKCDIRGIADGLVC